MPAKTRRQKALASQTHAVEKEENRSSVNGSVDKSLEVEEDDSRKADEAETKDRSKENIFLFAPNLIGKMGQSPPISISFCPVSVMLTVASPTSIQDIHELS